MAAFNGFTRKASLLFLGGPSRSRTGFVTALQADALPSGSRPELTGVYGQDSVREHHLSIGPLPDAKHCTPATPVCGRTLTGKTPFGSQFMQRCPELVLTSLSG